MGVELVLLMSDPLFFLIVFLLKVGKLGNIYRSVLGLHIDFADVFAQNSDGHFRNAAKEQHGAQGGDITGVVMPKKVFESG